LNQVLTTHVGSLIRPPELVEALRTHEQTDHSRAFERRLTKTVAEVVRHQAEIGLDIINDGEMSKPSWISYFYGRVSGIERRRVRVEDKTLPDAFDPSAYQVTNLWTTYVQDDGENATEGTTWVCTGPIVYDSRRLERDIANLNAALVDQDVVDGFMTAVAPGSIFWVENEYYDSEDEMMWAFAEALHEEYTRIVDAGLVLSVDDAVMWHRSSAIRLQGGSHAEYRRWAEPRIEALNYALRGIPADRVRYHICSGSNHGPHVHDAPLREIIELVLKVNAKGYEIEQSNAAHEHEWLLWEDVALPDDKVLIPGVVTHHTMMIEHPELVAQRITRLAKLVGRERVIAGTDCGFSQIVSRQRVSIWTQWAKLQSLVEGARIASEVLWGRQPPRVRTAGHPEG
jgi:5-methyltetrahydropteroyltriglutamate--homocysteine methyltransferase